MNELRVEESNILVTRVDEPTARTTRRAASSIDHTSISYPFVGTRSDTDDRLAAAAAPAARPVGSTRHTNRMGIARTTWDEYGNRPLPRAVGRSDMIGVHH